LGWGKHPKSSTAKAIFGRKLQNLVRPIRTHRNTLKTGVVKHNMFDSSLPPLKVFTAVLVFAYTASIKHSLSMADL